MGSGRSPCVKSVPSQTCGSNKGLAESNLDKGEIHYTKSQSHRLVSHLQEDRKNTVVSKPENAPVLVIGVALSSVYDV